MSQPGAEGEDTDKGQQKGGHAPEYMTAGKVEPQQNHRAKVATDVRVPRPTIMN